MTSSDNEDDGKVVDLVSKKKKSKKSSPLHDVSNLPAAKKCHVDTCHSSLLLQYPEILRRVYSFLLLQDALQIRCTCHELHEYNNTDVFRYSCIMERSRSLQKREGTSNEASKYMEIQAYVLCNLDSIDALHALLQNETFKNIAGQFLRLLVTKSKRDNGDAVSILLDSSQCTVESDLLDIVLRKGFSAMAEAFLQNDVINSAIQMCADCSNNIGCYYCEMGTRCCSRKCLEQDDPPIKYCRSCAVERYSCKTCSVVICEFCQDILDFHPCNKCRALMCFDIGCRCYLQECKGPGCHRSKCSSCVGNDREIWSYREGCQYCPTCHERGNYSS